MTRFPALALAAAGVLAAATLAAADGFQVIVNDANTTGTLTKAQVTNVFLKKTPRWPNGVSAVPIDQVDSSPARAAFSKDILGKSVAAVASYWQQQIFSGREVPPPQKSGDAAVVDFVKTNPGAVGYVAAGSPPLGVRVVAVVEK
jgi:ABC-type phosphate transport system substrate-binding protein